MKKGWTTTKLMAAGSLAVLTIILQLLGSSLTVVTGIPLASAAINILVAPAVMIICLLVIDQSGAATIMYIVVGILSLPLPLGGIPGFLPKVPIAIVEGVIADVLYSLLRQNKRIVSLVIGSMTMLYAGVVTVELGRLFDVPGIEQTANLLYSPLVVPITLMAALGGFLGWLIYSRIKNTAVIKRIQA